MKTVCELNKCTGCMACVDICPKEAIKVKDELDTYNAFIQDDLCINCNACHNICQNNTKPKFVEPINWYQGWAINADLRASSSSGGIATELMRAFVEQGGTACSCLFEKGQFIFKLCNKLDELKKFTGSKYVKSNPEGSYISVRKKLLEGEKVLFIGLPCQVAALKNYIAPIELQAQLYTVDLICHGSPSPQILDYFLNQYGHGVESVQEIGFRVKDSYQISEDNKTFTPKGVRDRYLIAFLNALIYTENCYSCQYAQKERVSDLTLGDSWGNDMPIEEQKKGVSLILCQSSKGQELLDQAELYLTDVDVEKAIQNNHQLREPSSKPVQRKDFFEGLRKDKKFNRLVTRCYKKQCMRQDIKSVLKRKS